MRLRIATFNLENLDDRPGLEPPLAARLDVLRPQLLRLRADVLCLQEVNAQGSGKRAPRRLLALDRLLAGTPYAGFARGTSHRRRGRGPLDIHNLVTLSRFPLAEVAQHWHDLVAPPAWRPSTAEPPLRHRVEWDRPLLHVALEVGGGRRLHVVNLHLRAPLAAFIAGQKAGPLAWKSTAAWAEGFYLAALKRAGQALEARLLIDRLMDADPHALIAVCGDFNAELREVPLRIIVAGEGDTGRGALAPRAMVPLEADLGAEAPYSVRHGGRAVLLDHLLVSRPLLAWYRGAEIHNEGLGDEAVAYAAVEGAPDSFHAPVVAEFELPDGGADPGDASTAHDRPGNRS